ncbi:MAG: Holliday junction branch migration protein RuvA [Firmicutes bacterium]|nr:Holliday junction branch migration protein RuvA [Bacillota bacterium]
MIRYLKGILAARSENAAIIDVNGIGYRVFIPSNSSLYLRQTGDEVTVFTHMAVREDDVSLYGFGSDGELELFEQLITVNSVGSKAAMAILSAMPVSEVKKAIMFEDVDMITRANGIGKKTAQKIVFELKDKIGTVVAEEQGYQLNEILPEAGSNKDSAIEALMGLGFSRAEAAESLKGVTDEDLSVEEYIKQALKNRG